MSGFFPVDHGDMEHPVFGTARRPFTRWEAYCWLLDHAAIRTLETEFQGKPVTLDRGQVATSVGDMARAWKWTRPAVQRFINGLISANFITYSPAVVAHLKGAPAPDTAHDTANDTPPDTGVTKLTLCKYYGIRLERRQPDTAPDTGPDTAHDTPPPMTPSKGSYVKKKEEGNKKEREGTSPATPATTARQGDLLPTAEIVAFAPPDEQLAFDAYNEAAKRLDLRECRSFSPARRAAMRARLRDLGGLEGWAIALDKVSESQFIRDWRTDGWTGFGLHSLLQPNTLAKLMDGAYNGQRRSERAQNPLWAATLRHREEHPEDSLLHHFDQNGALKHR